LTWVLGAGCALMVEEVEELILLAEVDPLFLAVEQLELVAEELTLYFFLCK